MAVSTVRLFNTLSRSIEPLKPLREGEIRLYCCGPTVYNYQHIGNLRTYVFEDTLVRTLRKAGYAVKHVMNITDVGHLVSDADTGEDKMLLAAKKEGKRSEELAEFYTQIFFDHCELINIKRPDVVCKATEHVPQMIEIIKMLEEKGLAYAASGNVYFDVSKFPEYGRLAQLDLNQLQAGARIEVDSAKRSPLDFALWFTKSKFENQELQWDSPWGRGYPGWHIECSAMSREYLGDEFDIHCGGIDHIPVHHTNEIAQSQGATGCCPAKIWMHGNFLVLGSNEGESSKMSKSSGEFLTLDLLQKRGFEPLAFRLLCLQTSYRSELSWSWTALEGAARALHKLKDQVASVLQAPTDAASAKENDYRMELREAVFNDLSTPRALATLYKFLGDSELSAQSKKNLLLECDELLGLDLLKVEVLEIPEEIKSLAEDRLAAKRGKDFKKADELRALITSKGYLIEDTKEGYTLKASREPQNRLLKGQVSAGDITG